MLGSKGHFGLLYISIRVIKACYEDINAQHCRIDAHHGLYALFNEYLSNNNNIYGDSEQLTHPATCLFSMSLCF